MNKSLSFFFLFLITFLLTFSPVVLSDVGDITTNFEDGTLLQQYNDGVFSVYSNDATAYIDDTHAYGSRAYRFDTHDTVFINWTTGSNNNMKYFEMRVYPDETDFPDGFLLTGYNSDDQIICIVKFENGFVKNQDHNGDWDMVSGDFTDDSYRTFNLTMRDTDDIKLAHHSNYKVSSPRYIRDNWNITRFTITPVSTGNSAWDIWIDNLVINNNAGGTGVQTPKISGVTVKTNGVDGVQDVLWGETAEYDIDVIGDNNAVVLLWIKDSDNQFIYSTNFGVGNHSFYVPYGYGRTYGEYTFWTVDSNLAYSTYFEKTYFNVTPTTDVISNYTAIYGDFFFEIEHHQDECYYITYDQPSIVYYLNDSYLDGTTDVYKYEIINPDGTTVFNGYVTVNDTYVFNKKYSSYWFEDKGEYFIKLFNTTMEDGDIVKDTLIYTSHSVDVCDYYTFDTDGDGIPDYLDRDINEPSNEYWTKTGEGGLITGVIIVLIFLIIGILIIKKIDLDSELINAIIMVFFINLGLYVGYVLNFIGVEFLFLDALVLIIVILYLIKERLS